MEIHRGPIIDEVQQYLDARWICAPEALWKIFIFTIYRMNPAVERLQIHLLNQQQVRFYKHQTINDVLNDDNNSKTMLTQFLPSIKEIPNLEHFCIGKFQSIIVGIIDIRNSIQEGQTRKLSAEFILYLLLKEISSSYGFCFLT